MGTTYTIHQSAEQTIELDEMSNKLQLYINHINGNCLSTGRLDPEQIIEIALEMLKVCSYWTEEGTVDKAIAAFKAKGYHW